MIFYERAYSGNLGRGRDMKIVRAAILIISIFVLTSCVANEAQRQADAKMRFKMGEVYFSEAKYSSALKELIAAVELHPDEPAYRHLLGLTYFTKKKYNDAATHLEEAVRLRPEFADARVNLGVVYMRLERWDAAIEQFNLAVENIFYGTPEVAHYNLGCAYYEKGDYKQSIVHFKKTISADNHYVLAFNNMGLAFDKLGMLEKAESSFKSAIKEEPRFAAAYFNLGEVLLKKKKRRAALTAFRKVVELAPQSDKARNARDYIELLR